jgi:hypothetical protein
MADKKISALTASTTPLAGTEVLPIVQSGATVKVAVSDLTAGRAISATQITLTAGNVIPANGFGVDFSATPGTGTSELLADYEEGTWTPTDASGAGLSLTVGSAVYTKIGNTVNFEFNVTYPVTLDVTGVAIGGLPFTSKNIVHPGGAYPLFTNYGNSFFVPIVAGAVSMNFYTTAAVQIFNNNFSGKLVRCFGTYFV